MNRETSRKQGLSEGNHVILGTGPLGLATASALVGLGRKVVLVNRSGKVEAPPEGASVAAGDIFDAGRMKTIIAGAQAIYQCAQPSYNRWPEKFPRLQDAVIELAASSGAKLVAAENLYLYGDPRGKALTEKSPYEPCSRKGSTRRDMTETLFAAHRAGKIRAASVRASDFFGPWDSVSAGLVYFPALRGKSVNFIGRRDMPHTFTYVRDFGTALAVCGTRDEALGRAWHAPSNPPLTQAEYLGLIEAAVGKPVKAMNAGFLMLSLIGLFDPMVKETVEMLYEFARPFVMDSSDFTRTFGIAPTPMARAVRETVEWARTRPESAPTGK